ncbi:MAG: DUF4396 domain-containing protein [Verrucomicrobiota bacterium]|nr:DUF4396 domain-containing protein [Verrucomicrobiota bacterium]
MNVLHLLADPTFVIAWYGFGALGAGWVVYDTLTLNRHVMPALKVGWPIIVIFFSALGLGLYLWSCRPPNIGKVSESKAKEVHHAFVSTTWKKVLGSVIHCVGGDGFGIISTMVITRALGVSFWTEFWIEYFAGFAFGWLVFQYLAMRHMGRSKLEALWKGGRAEFFSMITVMLGMGLVMRYVTPQVVGFRPMPDTAAFWGFAALGLFAGSLLTYPVNWWMVKIGWKHGMG